MVVKIETKNGTAELPALLSVQDVRKYLGVRSQLAYDLFDDPNFPSKKIGKSKFVTEDDFKEYLKSI